MSKPEMDLQAIREKLLNQRQQMGQSRLEDLPLDWSTHPPQPSRALAGPPPPAPPQPGPSPQLVNAVETLQQRSTQSLPGQVSAGWAAPAWTADGSTHVPLQQQHLQTLAEQINDWSARQEQAMLEMKGLVERWQREQRRQQPLESVGQLVPGLPILDFEGALVAIAEQDDEGNVALTYRPVDLHQADREATHLAQTLRSRNQRRGRSRPVASEPGFYTLLAEPLNGLSSLGCLAAEIGLAGWERIVEAVRLRSQSSPPFTVMDGIIWFGGGVIGRLALNLALTAYPGLWSLAVAAVTAMTAYALYRATLAPRLEFGLAYRVFLAVAGLLVGGRFF